MSSQLLGVRVTRTTPPTSHVVWTGYTEEGRAHHKEFIRTRCHDEETDGELSFEDISTEPVITKKGYYRATGAPLGVSITHFSADGRSAGGYTLKRSPRGSVKHGRFIWFWADGTPYCESVQIRVTGAA